jgi:ABC-type lipoprotein export system ATPase subunit
MLEASELIKIYTTEFGTRAAVRGVSLTIDSGEFVAVVGRSGSGKSTLLAMLGGLCRPTSGKVAIAGVDLWGLSEAKRAAVRNREVGLVFQFPSLLPTLRIIDNVALPALVRGALADNDAYRRAAELLVRVGLGDRTGAYPVELSGGEQRRAALARAIVNAPPIVLADEPTSDLDEDTEAEILEALAEIHRRDGVTLVIVTHNAKIAERADRIIEIRKGSIVASRTGSNLLFEMPGQPSSVVRDQKQITETPVEVSLPPAIHASSAGLGSGLGTWLLAVAAWIVPAILLGLALNQGVALYQRQLFLERRKARAALEDAALLWLRADIDDVTHNGEASYTLALSLKNPSAAHEVFVLSPSLRAYVQVGLTWQEVPTRSIDGQQGRVVPIRGRRDYRFVFEPKLNEFTEQLSGYMHVRLTGSTLVSQHSAPGDDLVERVDDYYIHLKPPGADDAAILRKVKFPGKPPLWIPMPPH